MVSSEPYSCTLYIYIYIQREYVIIDGDCLIVRGRGGGRKLSSNREGTHGVRVCGGGGEQFSY